MQIDSLRITKLRDYLFNVLQELDDDLKQINANFLSDDVNNYSIDKVPTSSIVEKWIMGYELHRDVYSFRSRMLYSPDAITNLENVGFFELFEQKIEEKNKKKILPEIEGIQSISCLNCGSLINANTNTAEFDMQIQIEYIVNQNKEVISL